MVTVINNECNKRCDYCFEGDAKDEPKKEMSLDDFKRIICMETRQPADFSIMGGEPTLHPKFMDIVTLAKQSTSASNMVLVLTNGLCEPAIMKELMEKNVGVLLHLNHNIGAYTDREWEVFTGNIDVMSKYFKSFAISVTIDDPSADFSKLFEILKWDIHNALIGIRVGISTPGYKFANRFPKDFKDRLYGFAYQHLLQGCHAIRPTIQFTNECPVNLCMVEPEIYRTIKPRIYKMDLKCYGNMDILPDMSMTWCFPSKGIPELTIPDIRIYQSLAEAENELYKKMVTFQTTLNYSACTGCGTLPLLECYGPCVLRQHYHQIK